MFEKIDEDEDEECKMTGRQGESKQKVKEVEKKR